VTPEAGATVSPGRAATPSARGAEYGAAGSAVALPATTPPGDAGPTVEVSARAELVDWPSACTTTPAGTARVAGSGAVDGVAGSVDAVAVGGEAAAGTGAGDPGSVAVTSTGAAVADGSGTAGGGCDPDAEVGGVAGGAAGLTTGAGLGAGG
jgi:hypothetical protein